MFSDSRRTTTRGSATVTVTSQMGSFTRAVADAAWNAIVESAEAIRADVAGPGTKNPAPIDTGRLRKSYRVLKFRKEFMCRVQSNWDRAHYAIYQEFGTRFHRAQPHLRPAAETEAKNIPKRFEKHFAKVKTRKLGG